MRNIQWLSVIALVWIATLAFNPAAEAQNRHVVTYDGGYLIGGAETVSSSTAPCPQGTHVCEHTYREYGPDGLISERIHKHCIPQGRAANSGTLGHATQYDEWDYRYGPPPIKYPVRQYVQRTPVYVNPPVVYSAPSYYYDRGYGGYSDYVVGDTLLGGAIGAAAGAAIGAVVGSPGDGAAIGAVVGGLNALSRGALGHGLLW